jgi:hypothetical protein
MQFQPSVHSFSDYGETPEPAPGSDEEKAKQVGKKMKRLARKRMRALKKAKRRVWLVPTVAGGSIFLAAAFTLGIRHLIKKNKKASK